jgi:hypothetical protein
LEINVECGQFQRVHAWNARPIALPIHQRKEGWFLYLHYFTDPV